MSNHNRKRKHRGATRPNHNRNDDYPDFHDTQSKFPAFLSHHDAYQASHGPFAPSSTPGGFEKEIPVSEERNPAHIQDPLQALYIQAYEADIIRGPNARTTAESLEVVQYVDQASKSEGKSKNKSDSPESIKVVPKIGSALIQLQLNGASASQRSPSEHGGGFASGSGSMRVFDEDEDCGIAANLHPNLLDASQSIFKNSIWVDRYDARLLLDAPLPTTPSTLLPTSSAIPPPASPTGWSDLSSDAEDMFFFDPRETEDFRREKRRRILEKTREERLRARMEEDGDAADEEAGKAEEEEVWGGSDEEPDQTQKDLMSRTATHLLSSPNPAQLEMRILANHGRDRRFAFLRGRWSKAWSLIKAKARLEQAKAKAAQESQPEKNVGLGLLAGYGSGSEEEEEAEEEENKNNAQDLDEERPTLPSQEEVKVPENIVESQMNEDEMAKEARRKRLKVWSEQRKAAREKGEDVGKPLPS